MCPSLRAVTPLNLRANSRVTLQAFRQGVGFSMECWRHRDDGAQWNPPSASRIKAFFALSDAISCFQICFASMPVISLNFFASKFGKSRKTCLFSSERFGHILAQASFSEIDLR